jgi:hypothetical protein
MSLACVFVIRSHNEGSHTNRNFYTVNDRDRVVDCIARFAGGRLTGDCEDDITNAAQTRSPDYHR